MPQDRAPGIAAAQVSQAVKDVYGRHIPADEIQHRYLVERSDGGTSVRAGGLTLAEDYPDLAPSLWAQTAPLAVSLVGLPWLVYLALTMRSHTIGATPHRIPWASLLLISVLTLFLLGSDWSYTMGYTACWKVTALGQILLRKLSTRLPGGPAVWWAVVIALYGVVYVLAQRRFERIEAPARA